MSSVSEKFRSALGFHESGELNRATELYGQVLRVDPCHADSLHLMGVAALQQSQQSKALDYLSRAIKQNDRVAAYHSNLGSVYRSLNRNQEAELCYLKAVKLKPEFFDARFNLGNLYFAQGNLAEAEISFRVVTKLQPKNVHGHYNLSLVFKRQRKFEEAISQFEKTLELNPQYKEARNNLGVVYLEMQLPEKALEVFQVLLDQSPGDANVLNNIANVHSQLDQPELAIEHFHQALAIDPSHHESLFNLANCYKSLDQFSTAIEWYKRALEHSPDNHDVLNNMGNTFARLERLEEAEHCLRRALLMKPDLVTAAHSLGTLLRDQVRFDEASEFYEQALAIDPCNPGAVVGKAVMELRQGRYRSGWIGYDLRAEIDPRVKRDFGLPDWSGEDLTGKTILVYAEQGIGCEILHSSCLPDLMACGGRVVLECDRRIKPVFRRSFPGVQLVERTLKKSMVPSISSEPLDFQIASGSLPMHFRNSRDEFPIRDRYLLADNDNIAEWNSRLQQLGEGLKVGISWRGGKEAHSKGRKSTNLNQWLGLLSVPDVHFVNVQYGDCVEELADLKQNHDVVVHDWNDSDALAEQDFFAAQLMALDLVISISNSTVHLAGSLGVPTWLLLTCACDWRWLAGTEETTWYSSVRQFEQEALNEWEPVFEKVKQELLQII